MREDQLEFFRKLDPKCEYGTLQGLLLDASTATEMAFAKRLLKLMVGDRQALLEENKTLTKILVDNDLYTSENLGLN